MLVQLGGSVSLARAILPWINCAVAAHGKIRRPQGRLVKIKFIGCEAGHRYNLQQRSLSCIIICDSYSVYQSQNLSCSSKCKLLNCDTIISKRF